MPLSDIVNVVISVQSAQLERAGFGIPCILGLKTLAGFNERARQYSSLAGMVSDGWLTTDVEYLEAQRLLSQTPRPPTFLIARRANKPTLRWALTPVVLNSTVYQVKVNGTTVSYTSDATATAGEIILGLKTAIDALALPITTSDQTTSLRVLENVAGAWHSLEPLNPALLGVRQDHADAGIAADLAAILAENSSWYGLLSPDASQASIEAAAAWVEANKKLYLADSQDTDIEMTVLAGATDVAASLKTSGYARTAVTYHRSNAAMFGAGWMGRVFPIDAGSETWGFKTLAGVPAMSMTDAQATNVINKKANHYTAIYGRSLTQKGTSASGEFIDVTRGSDWQTSDIGERVFLALTSPDKLSYDDGGVSVVKSQVKASLKAGVDRKFLAAIPEPTVTAPLVADISDADKGSRTLPDVNFEATLAGAIQSTTITGVVRA